MIYTVTLNPAADKTAQVPNFSIDAVNRIEELRQDAGGKGINVSKVVAALGGETEALCLLAGNAGRWIQDQLESLRIAYDPFEVAGETRTNLKLVDPIRGTHTDINEPGPTVTREALAEVLSALESKVTADDVVVLAGSLPAGASPATYASWVDELGRRGCRTYLDADGEALRLGVEARPSFIKPNLPELSELCGRRFQDNADVARTARDLVADGISRVVVSLGSEGALFVSEAGAWLARAPKVTVGSTVGSGDSVVAAIAYSEQVGLAEEGTMRLSMACGAANAMQSGTQAAPRELVDSLVSDVVIEQVL
jgi:1-phosphofructokinase